MNPLVDLVEQYKQQTTEDTIRKLQADILELQQERRMMKLIDLEIFQDIGGSRIVRKVSVNPEYIVFVKEDKSHSFISLSNGTVLHAIESRSSVLGMIGSADTVLAEDTTTSTDTDTISAPTSTYIK